MQIDTIFDEWNIDANIDINSLDRESIKIPKLHGKYFRYLSNERLLLVKYQSDYKKLKLDKLEYYSGVYDERELKEKGLRPFSRKLILKNDMETYIDGDQDIINLSLKIGLQKEKVSLLESILAILSKREFQIKGAIDFQKLQAGQF